MKKFLFPVLILVLFVGCDSKSQTGFKGVTAKKDYVSEGMKFLNEADIPRAIRSFDMAIKQDPTNVDNYLVLGQVYMRLKQYDRAVDTLSAATRVSPENGEVYYLLATSKALDGRMEGAIESAQRSVEIYMQNRDEDRFKKAVVLLKSLSVPQDKPEIETQEAQAAE